LHGGQGFFIWFSPVALDENQFRLKIGPVLGCFTAPRREPFAAFCRPTVWINCMSRPPLLLR
jgi:hypothetical protein